MRIGIVTHPGKKQALVVARKIVDHLKKRGAEGKEIEVVLDDGVRKKLHGIDADFAPIDMMAAEIVIAIGGDGTLLRTFQAIDVPVLGINVGSLGFLMEVSPDRTEEAMDRILDGRYTVKERSKLHTRIGDEDLPDATNEVVLLSKTPAKMVSYEMYIDMNWVEKVRGDGLIVSTPVGSTCYALSAGGAIIDPEIPAFEIVALAPFITNIRPMIIPDSSVINIKIVDKMRSTVVAVDGAYLRSLKRGEEILIKKAKRTAKFIRFDLDFYRQLHDIIAVARPYERKKRKYR